MAATETNNSYCVYTVHMVHSLDNKSMVIKPTALNVDRPRVGTFRLAFDSMPSSCRRMQCGEFIHWVKKLRPASNQ